MRFRTAKKFKAKKRHGDAWPVLSNQGRAVQIKHWSKATILLEGRAFPSGPSIGVFIRVAVIGAVVHRLLKYASQLHGQLRHLLGEVRSLVRIHGNVEEATQLRSANRLTHAGVWLLRLHARPIVEARIPKVIIVLPRA